MKRTLLTLAGLAVAACGWPIFATTSTTTDTPADTTWVNVGQAAFAGGNASCVAIGPRTLLTAAHVNPDHVVMGGNSFAVANSVTYSDATGNWDLRLLNVTSDLPGYYQMAAGTTVGSSLTMAGYGYSGFVRSDLTGYQTNDATTTTRRAGTNSLTDEGDYAGLGHYLESYLDSAGQAAVSVGDSGGGFFDATGKLEGIISFYNNDTDIAAGLPSGAPPPPPKLQDFGFDAANPNGWQYHSGPPWNIDVVINPGEHYFSSGAIDITSAPVQNWIRQNSAVPEPASLGLLGFGAVALLKRRKK